MQTDQLLLIDLSAIAHQIFHVSGNEPDPSYISNQIIARVRSLASEHPYAAICCDAGKSFRADIDPTYKANRDTENRAPLRHQMDVACDVLRGDGFPVWRVPGFEADDLIASAVTQALAIDGTTVLIASADKDMTQLVSDRVSMKKITDGSIVGPAEVLAKFKVHPWQMHDFLCLVGDVSDNIIGARGIGGVTAAKLLNAHGSITAIYDAMALGVVKELTPALRTSLQEFRARRPVVSQLITLRTDAPIEFSEIAAERVAKPMEEDIDMAANAMGTIADAIERGDITAAEASQGIDADIRELDQNESLAALGGAVEKAKARIETNGAAVKVAARQPTSEVLGPVGSPAPSSAQLDFSQQLEPRNMDDAVKLAQRMFESRLFSAYGTPQAVLATVLAGRELGIPAMASLRAMHVIDGKPTLSADTLAALVIKSGKAKYFRCTERTAEQCTFVTQRLPVEDYPEQSLTVTLKEMKDAWRKDEKAWMASGWGKTPAAMLVARAKSALARLEYPDVVGNLYGFEELD